MDGSKIEWTDATWNPIRGCSRVSEGCRHCYAERVAARFNWPVPDDGMENLEKGLPPSKAGPYHGLAAMTKDGPRWTGEVRFVEDKLDAPLRWKKPRRIFVNSMSDLFHEKVPDKWIDLIFAVMALAPKHTFQVLTKRPERMLSYFSVGNCIYGCINDATRPQKHRTVSCWWPLPNVWLGVSVEDQATADKRIPLLLQTPTAVRWVSYEPALGPIDLHQVPPGGALPIGSQGVARDGLDWIVVGGESGPGARPFDLAWARAVVAQGKAAGVPVFVKQLGAQPFERMISRGHPFFMTYKNKKGGDPAEWPEDLRVREYPKEGVCATS